MRALGIDTSNYTTSAAVFDGSGGYNAGRLLEVRPGELGLRQSDALFQHIKHLPGRFAELQAEGWLTGLSAVGASTRPRAVEGSYMPCFLAGEGQGRTLADALGVPFYAVSHQQGHIAAAAWSAGRLELLDRPMLAWHRLQGKAGDLRRRPSLLCQRLSLILHPGKGECQAVQLYRKSPYQVALRRQGVQRLSRREGQAQEHAGAVDELSG